MTTFTIYRYTKGATTVYSPLAPEEGTPYETLCRLVADEGRELVNTSGDRTTCIDTSTPDEWTEVDAIEPEEEPATDEQPLE